MSHTPGPWKSITNGVYGDTTILDAAGEHIIADAIDNEDNARLLEAAPELLEAARRALQLLEGDYPGAANEIRAAIAKAEGK